MVWLALARPLARKRKLARLVVNSSGLQVILGLADAGHFRRGVNDAGDDIVVHMARLACENFGHRNAFILRLVGEHGATDHVADGIDSLNAGCEVIIDLDAATFISATPASFAAEPFGVGHAANGDEHHIGFQRFSRAAGGGFDGERNARLELWRPVTLWPSLKVKPCFCSRRWKSLATSLSMPGRMRSRYSITVTLEPRRA